MSGPRAFRTATIVLVMIAGIAQSVRAKQTSAELQEQYEKLSRQFAADNPNWRPVAPKTGTLLFVASDEYTPPYALDVSTKDMREKHAEALFDLARQAAEAGQLSLSFQWATETVRENPDHAEARRVLGYEQREGQWLTAYGLKMFDAGKVWDPKRGWVAKADAASSKEKDDAEAARHADIKSGWQVRTDHFQVTTNHSQAAGAELAVRLEQLYQIWRQLFAGFYYTPLEVRALFAGERNARVLSHPFHVIYYRNKQEYVEALRRQLPQVGKTLGLYNDATHIANFFAGDKNSASTLYHEAVHQLFQESKPTGKHIGLLANFWVVEGVATYFESLTEHVDSRAGLYFTVGDLTVGERLQFARKRMGEGYYIPIGELARLGRGELQHSPQIIPIYGESCALAAFLIDGEQGRYREPFVRYLQAVYAGKDNEGSLAELTESSFTELDAQFRRYLLQSLP
ncbi:MAG TPA: hypothetical protein VH107_00420 [Lacipirellulaceae bacterium]|nr:hypothetical protein [Lacipirellulaceae bacterium]